MPLVKPTQLTAQYNPYEIVRDNIEQQAEVVAAEEAVRENTSFKDSLWASYKRNTIWGSALDRSAARDEFEETYTGERRPVDIFGADKALMDGQWDNWESFVDVETMEDFEFTKLRIQQENEYRKQATFWTDLISGVADPVNLIPLVGAGGRVANMTRMAGAAVLSETLLHSTQETRTLEESAIQIAASAAIGSLFKGVPHPKGMTDDAVKQLEREATVVHGGGGSAGAMAVSRENLPKLVDTTQVGGRLNAARLSPNSILQTADAPSARTLGEALADTPTITKANLEGTATLESLESGVRGHMNKLASIHQGFNEMKKAIFRSRIFKGGPAVSLREMMERVTQVARTGADDVLPEITKMGKMMRQTFDEYGVKLRTAGLADTDETAPLLQDYINRVALPQEINRSRDELTAMLRNDLARLGGDPLELEYWADDIVKSLAGETRARTPIPSQVRRAMPKALRERTMDEILGNPKYGKFFEQRADILLDRYIRSVAPKLESRRLGYGDSVYDHFYKDINDEYGEMIREASARSDTKAVDRLTAQKQKVLRTAQGLEDRITGKQLFANEHNVIHRAARTIKQLNFLAMMGQVLVASLADPAKVLMEFGLRRSVSTAFNLTRNIANSEFRKLSKQQLTKFGALVDLATSQRAQALLDLDDFVTRQNKIEHTLGVLSTKMMGAPTGFFNHWNAMWKSVSAFNAIDEVVTASQKVVTGKATKHQIAELASMGIDENMARQIAKQIGDNPSKFQGIHLVDTGTWADADLATRFEQAINRRVNVTIVQPGKGDIPLWADGPLASIILQFKSFAIASHDRTFVRGLQRAAALGKGPQLLSGAAAAVAMGAVGNEIKAAINKREMPDRGSKAYFYQALDRAGLAPVLELYNISNGLSGNWMSSMTGLSSSREQYNRHWVDVIGGPTAGTINKLREMSLDALDGDFDKKTAKNATELLPFNNALLGYLPMLFGLKSAHEATQEVAEQIVE